MKSPIKRLMYGPFVELTWGSLESEEHVYVALTRSASMSLRGLAMKSETFYDLLVATLTTA